MTIDEAADLLARATNGDKIAQIAAIKRLSGCGLRDAKQAAEVQPRLTLARAGRELAERCFAQSEEPNGG